MLLLIACLVWHLYTSHTLRMHARQALGSSWVPTGAINCWISSALPFVHVVLQHIWLALESMHRLLIEMQGVLLADCGLSFAGTT